MFSRYALLSTAALAVAALAATVSTPASASEECIRTQQVRAFATDSADSLIVRQGPSRFHRVEVAPGCQLDRADRIGFAQGNAQLYTMGRGSQVIPTSSSSLQTRFCSATPHAYVTVIDNSEDVRTRCRIQSIQPSTRAAFEAADNRRDKRY